MATAFNYAMGRNRKLDNPALQQPEDKFVRKFNVHLNSLPENGEWKFNEINKQISCTICIGYITTTRPFIRCDNGKIVF